MNIFIKSSFIVLAISNLLCGICFSMDDVKMIKICGPVQVLLQHIDKGLKVVLDEDQNAFVCGCAKVEFNNLMVGCPDKAWHKIHVYLNTAALEKVFLENRVVLTCLSPITIANELMIHVLLSSTLYCNQAIAGKRLLIDISKGGELFIDQLACDFLRINLSCWSNASICSINPCCIVTNELNNHSCLKMSGYVAEVEAIGADIDDCSIYDDQALIVKSNVTLI